MKKIIKGKMYNTETAEEIGSWSVDDYNYVKEILYLKATGEFFLLCEGDYDNQGNIIPLTEHKAKEWVEKHLTVDVYISLFGEVEE